MHRIKLAYFLLALDNYLQVMSKFQQFETQIRQLKVKKANYQHSLDRAIVLNPDEDVDMNESKLARSILDINKKIQRLEKKQKSIGETLKVRQLEVKIMLYVFQLQLLNPTLDMNIVSHSSDPGLIPEANFFIN